MATKPAPDPLVSRDVAVRLLNELDYLLGQTALELCHIDTDNGSLTECTPQANLLRKLAVAAQAGKIVKMIETSLLAKAANNPHITQADIAAALGVTKQGASYRVNRLKE